MRSGDCADQSMDASRLLLYAASTLMSGGAKSWRGGGGGGNAPQISMTSTQNELGADTAAARRVLHGLPTCHYACILGAPSHRQGLHPATDRISIQVRSCVSWVRGRSRFPAVLLTACVDSRLSPLFTCVQDMTSPARSRGRPRASQRRQGRG